MAQFANTDSITATDVNNMLRGLHSTTSGTVLTGTTAETDLFSITITAATIGATGALMVIVEGNITNVSGGAKTMRLKLGSTTLMTVSRTGANAQDWLFWGFIFNRTTTAQTISFCKSTADAVTVDFDRITSAEDTTGNLTLNVTGQLANANDTISSGIFKVFVVQVT